METVYASLLFVTLGLLLGVGLTIFGLRRVARDGLITGYRFVDVPEAWRALNRACAPDGVGPDADLPIWALRAAGYRVSMVRDKPRGGVHTEIHIDSPVRQ